jgi:hypothetical protein
LRWAERIHDKQDPTEDAVLHFTHHTPCNNWRIAAGMGDTMHNAVRINDAANDGVTLEYINNTPLNIYEISGEGNTATQSTETLTLWRKLYIEQDYMQNVNFSEGPENLHSVRLGQVLGRGVSGGRNYIRIALDFGQVDQFQNGRASFLGLDRFGAPTRNLGTRIIRGNTGGAAPNRVYLGAAAPADSHLVILYDDDVNPADLNASRPHVQPGSPPVNLFNDTEGFPAACIEADFDTLNTFDTNNATFDLNIRNEMATVAASKGTRGGRLFWVVTLFGAYQYQVTHSFDPDVRVTRGISCPYWYGPTTPDACGGIVTFYEAIRDQTTNWRAGAADTLNTRLQRTTLHEVGHVMGGRHTDGGLMTGGIGTNPGHGMFSPVSLRRFMLIHDEGPGHK